MLPQHTPVLFLFYFFYLFARVLFLLPFFLLLSSSHHPVISALFFLSACLSVYFSPSSLSQLTDRRLNSSSRVRHDVTEAVFRGAPLALPNCARRCRLLSSPLLPSRRRNIWPRLDVSFRHVGRLSLRGLICRMNHTRPVYT